MTTGRALIVMTPPTAARLGRVRARIARIAAESFSRCELVLTSEPRAVRERIDAFDPDVIIAAGGDGTVNLALQAMRESDGLAVLPLGMANDLARAIAGSGPAASQRIDSLRVNGRRFCTTGGLGLPAEVAGRVNTLRNAGRGRWLSALGSRTYPLVALQQCLCGPPLDRLEITWEDLDQHDGRMIEVETHGVFVSNQATFARSLRVVDDADNRDGRFELSVLLARGRQELLGLLARVVRGRVGPSDVRIIRTRRARIRAEREVAFFGDGEILCRGREFELEIDERGLMLVGAIQPAEPRARAVRLA